MIIRQVKNWTRTILWKSTSRIYDHLGWVIDFISGEHRVTFSFSNDPHIELICTQAELEALYEHIGNVLAHSVATQARNNAIECPRSPLDLDSE